MLAPAELLRLLDAPLSADAYPQAALLIDGQADALDAAPLARLRELPLVLIAVAAEDNALSRACDTRVSTREEGEKLLRAAQARPLAATILVQLLRLQASLSLEDALQAESLAYATLQAGAEFRAWLAEHRAEALAVHRDHGPAVLIEREDARLALTLNRPSLRNSMSVALRDGLLEALQLVLADDSIRQVQLRGRGRCFSVGGELSEFGTASDPASAHRIRSLGLPGRLLARCRERVEVHLHGACIGSGIEFPAFAGRLVAQADAWFQLPELQFGLIPGAGGTVSIARRIGAQRLVWMVLSGKRVDAATALRWGLIDALADAE